MYISSIAFHICITLWDIYVRIVLLSLKMIGEGATIICHVVLYTQEFVILNPWVLCFLYVCMCRYALPRSQKVIVLSYVICWLHSTTNTAYLASTLLLPCLYLTSALHLPVLWVWKCCHLVHGTLTYYYIPYKINLIDVLTHWSRLTHIWVSNIRHHLNQSWLIINYTDPAWLSLTNERKFVD